MVKKRTYRKTSKGKTHKVDGESTVETKQVVTPPKKVKEEKKKKSFFSGFGKKKDKTKVDMKERKVPLEPIDSNLVTYTVSLLTPGPNDPEQLVVVERLPNGTFDFRFIQEGNMNSVQKTDPELYEAGRKSFKTARPNSLYDIHTHPVWAPHSIEDTRVFVEFKSVKEAIVVTPHVTDDGQQVVYVLEKTVSKKEYNQANFDKDWAESMDIGKDTINQLNKDDKPWFEKESLVTGADDNRKVAEQLKGLQEMGSRYGFIVKAKARDRGLLNDNLFTTSHEYDSDNFDIYRSKIGEDY